MTYTALTARAFERRCGNRRHARGGGARRAPLQVLMQAAGAIAFFDTSYGVTKNGSDQVSQLLSRIGSYTVDQSTDANKPVWGALSPTGKRGFTFTAASSQRLVAPNATLAGLLDGSQAYSSLWVAKQAAAGQTEALWGIGSTTTTDSVYEGVVSTGGDRRRRFQTAATQNDGNALGTSIVLGTTVYTGAAYSSWINGTASLAAQANIRAPACDTFSVGAFMSNNVLSNHWDGEFYCLLISLSQWTTSQRQSYERAAKRIWGTP